MDAVNGNGLSDGQKPFKQSLYTADEFNGGTELPKLHTKLNDSSTDCNLGTYIPANAELGRELPELPTMPVDSLVPLTPDCVREIGGNGHYSASPVYILPRALCFNSNQDYNPVVSNGDSPGTPKNSVFDPFAQGPDHLMLAPRCQKYNEDSQTSAARRLKFKESPSFVRYSGHNDNNSKEAICVEETLFETVYNNLLEVIVSEQNEEFLAGISNHTSYSSGDRTPTSSPLLSGIAETCPAAPKKPTTKFRNINMSSLCKRLEF